MLLDLRLAFRQLVKSPGFSLVAILTLALGIGANTAIFSFINTLFLKNFSVKQPEQLVSLYTTDERNPGLLQTSHLNYTDYRERNQVFADMACFAFAPANFSVNGEASQIFGEIVSGNYFDLLGVSPTLGRTFLPEEYRTPGTHPVVVLGYRFWQSQLAGDPGVIGRPLHLNGTAFTVIGIAPADFRGLNTLNSPAFWVSTASYRQILNGLFLDFFETRRALLFNAVARLKPGVVLSQAAASLEPLSAELARQFPTDNQGRGLRLVPLAESGIDPNQRQNFQRAGALLLSLAGLVLLIACGNIANLLLARATGRQREVALRMALGAARSRLIRQFLTESLLLSVLGGAAGIMLAGWSQKLLWALRPPFFPDDLTVTLDSGVLGFALCLTLLTGALFGLAPAWSATKPALTAALNEESGGAAARAPLYSVRNLLIAGQIALAVIALVFAGLFIRSLRYAQQADPGWNTRNLALLSVNIAAQGYSGEKGIAYYRAALEKIRTVPSVIDATVASGPLLNGGGFLRTLRPQGDDEKLRTAGQLMSYNHIWPGFLRSMGIPLVAGRDFSAMDDGRHALVVIINEHLAKLAWPNRDPIGQTLKVFGSEKPVEIIGVVKDVTYDNIGEDPKPYAFFSLAQEADRGGFGTFQIRTQGDSAALLPTLRRELQALDPAMPLINVTTMEENIRQGLWASRTGAALLSIFGGLALLLAALGVYGTMSYSIGRRTREIGIRMAVGAQPSDVMRLVLHQGFLVVSAGLLAGLGVAFLAARYFQNFLFGIGPNDWATYTVISLILAFIALLACYLPARRATRIDPLVALRTD